MVCLQNPIDIDIRQDRIGMKQGNERRVQSTITCFSAITFLLSLGPISCLVLSLIFQSDLDEHDPIFGDIKLNYWENVPFTVLVLLFTLLQVFASITTFVANLSSGKTKTIYYSSVIGMLASFGLGMMLVNLAIEYNFETRSWPKDTDLYPMVMPLYWSLQVAATFAFLFILPMHIFVFYNKLEPYLALQRAEQRQNGKQGRGQSLQGWLLLLFLFHSVGQIVLIVNSYQYTAAQDTANYRMDNMMDMLTSYYSAALVVEFIGVIILMTNINSCFLSKPQTINLTILIGLFMMGSLVLETNMAAKIFIEVEVGGELICRYKDCDSLNAYKWDCLGYSILNLVAVLLFFPYLNLVSTKPEQEEQRATLISSQERASI